MNKKIFFVGVIVLIISLMSLVGCGSKISVKDDLSNYDAKVTEAITTMKTDGNALQAGTENMGKLVDIMSEAKKKIANIDVKTDEVKELNKLLISGYDGMISAYTDMVTAMKNKDEDLNKKANEKGEASQKIMDDFNNKANELAKKEGITLKMTEIK